MAMQSGFHPVVHRQKSFYPTRVYQRKMIPCWCPGQETRRRITVLTREG